METKFIYMIIFAVEILFFGIAGIILEILSKENKEEIFLISKNLSKIMVIILTGICWIIMDQTKYEFDYDIILKPKKPWQIIEMVGGLILFCLISFVIYKSGDGIINKVQLIVLLVVLAQLYYIIKNKSEYDKKIKSD